MKKLLTFSFIGTIAIVFLGAMFIFGFVDFNVGQNNLIGYENESINEVELQNSIVEDVHEIGNNMNSIVILIKGLTIDSLLDELKEKEKHYSKYQQELEALTLPESSSDKPELYEYLKINYLPTVQSCGEKFRDAITDFEENGITQEKIDSLNIAITQRYEDYVQIHNEFVEILNQNR